MYTVVSATSLLHRLHDEQAGAILVPPLVSTSVDAGLQEQCFEIPAIPYLLNISDARLNLLWSTRILGEYLLMIGPENNRRW